MTPNTRKKDKGVKSAAALAAPDVQLSEDEPNDGYLYLHAPRHMARHDEQMAEAFSLVRGKSELGGRIVSAAQKRPVKFLRTEFESASTKGRYYHPNKILLSAGNLLPDDGTVLPHELMHWMQPNNFQFAGWDYRSRLLAVFSAEAGAETCAVKVTHQMRDNGYGDSFRAKSDSSEWNNYKEIYQKFDRVLNKARRKGWDTPVLDATDAAFHQYFKQENLLYIYGNGALLDYMKSIKANMKHYPIPSFGLNAAMNQAKIREDEYLVYNPVQLPLKDEKLVPDYTLWQAFEYTEMLHILNFCNGQETALAFHRKIRALEEDENPFIYLNSNEVLVTYEGQKNAKDSKDIVRVMMDMAGVEEWFDPQSSFDFT